MSKAFIFGVATYAAVFAVYLPMHTYADLLTPALIDGSTAPADFSALVGSA